MDVPYLIERWAELTPEREMWRLDDRSIDYREGVARIRRLARFLHAATPPGARVAILSNNRFEGVETFLATLLAGRVAVPIHVKLAEPEIRYILEDSGASALVHAPELAERCARVVPEGVRRLEFDGVSSTDEAPGSYEAAVRAAGAESPPRPSPDDTAWLFYTSGTTGRPKGACETHRNLVTMIEQFLLQIIPDTSAEDCYLHVAPISHSSTSCALPYLARGASNAFHGAWSFDAAEVLDCVRRHRATSTFLVPTMIHDLQVDTRELEDDFPLRTVIYGGGPAHETTMRRARERFGMIFAQFYGQGEAPVTITGMSAREQAALVESGREDVLNSVGRECFAVQLQIRDAEDREVSAGVTGEVWVRGDLVMSGYWDNPGATAETIRDGWLRTGDMGHRDTEGYLYLTDRSKDVVISGGSNVYPREIEEIVLSHPDVDEAAAFGIPDERWGEVVAVAITGARPLTVEEIREHIGDRLAGYKHPRTVLMVDAIPRNAAGKIMKRALRAEFDERGRPR